MGPFQELEAESGNQSSRGVDYLGRSFILSR